MCSLHIAREMGKRDRERERGGVDRERVTEREKDRERGRNRAREGGERAGQIETEMGEMAGYICSHTYIKTDRQTVGQIRLGAH